MTEETLTRARVRRDADAVSIDVVLGGHGEHRSAVGSTGLARGDLTVVGVGAWHDWRPRPSLRVRSVRLRRRVLARELRWLRDEPGAGPLFRDDVDPLVPEPVGHWRIGDADVGAFVAITDRIRAQRTDRPFGVLAPVAELLGLLDAHLSAASTTTALPATVRPTTWHVVEVLRHRLDEPWTLDRIAALVHLSPSQVNRVVRADLGRTPLEVLQYLRAERMADLLAGSDCTVAAAGAAVGWPDPDHAARRFARRYGSPPSRWRAGMR